MPLIPSNVADFDRPPWRVIASGFDTETWFNDGQAVGTGGIHLPQATRLAAGNDYDRLAGSSSPRPAQLGGGWWVDFEAISTIHSLARTHGYRLKEAARLLLALPYT